MSTSYLMYKKGDYVIPTGLSPSLSHLNNQVCVIVNTLRATQTHEYYINRLGTKYQYLIPVGYFNNKVYTEEEAMLCRLQN